MKIHKPLFMVGKKIPCWKCTTTMSVIALIAPNTEGLDCENEVCILCSITDLPEELIGYIQSRVPSYQMTYSNTAGDFCFANTCPKCKALTGDFYLHNNVGGAFFPIDEDGAKELYLVELPITEPVEIEGDYRCGTAEMILENAHKIS